MMKGIAWKRGLSLLLAIQMLCAPVAMALAEEQVTEEFHPAVGEEFAPADPQPDPKPEHPLGDDAQGALAAAIIPFRRVRLSFGMPLDGGQNPFIWDGYFDVEVEDAHNWGTRQKDTFYTGISADGTRVDYTYLPGASTLGRVPDMVFSGFYAYNVPNVEDLDLMDISPVDMAKWSYTDLVTAGVTPVELLAAEKPTEILGGGKDDDDVDTGTLTQITGNAGGIDPDLTEKCFPIIGHWEKSPHSTLTAMELTTQAGTAAPQAVTTAYTTQIEGKNVADLAGDAVALADFDGTQKELWLRVPGDMDTLNLNLEAFEPYYDHHKNPGTTQPVAVKATFGEGTTQVEVPLTGMLTSQMTPQAAMEGAYYTPANSMDDPARSQWSYVGIPLKTAAGTGALFTNITIQVTAPDGTTQSTYLIHVQRQADPTLTLKSGNTPFGMIDRDTSPIWKRIEGTGAEAVGKDQEADTIAANKATAKEYFRNNLTFHPVLFPQDATNSQQGSVFKGIYTGTAWQGGINYDQSATTIVAYQDSAFTDPGFTLTDSEGNLVTFGTGAGRYEAAVERTITLRTADAITTQHYKKDAGAVCYYGGSNTLADAKTKTVVLEGNGTDQVDLRGLNVLPGIYTIHYYFTDPLLGTRFGGDEKDGFVNKDRALDFYRTLIVLPTPGDVDMDGAVTTADGVALEKGLAGDSFHGVSFAGDPVAALAARRVFDRDYNGTVNGDDVTKTMAGFQPTLDKLGDSDYYYLPLPQGDDTTTHARKAWSQVTAGGGATLSLTYLGRETGRRLSDGSTSGRIGPWNADPTQKISLPDATEGTQNDTFWLGVSIADVAKSTLKDKGIETFTFSLIYDSRYVRPAALYTAQEKIDAAKILNHTPSDQEMWAIMTRSYNLDANNTGTPWGTSGYTTTAALTPQRDYLTHYSKVISTLETSTKTSYLKEAVFSITLKENATAAQITDGVLFAMPFTLILHPYGKNFAQVVELGAGMREFTFVTQDSGREAALFAAPDATTSAYSAQSSIYGNATANLQGEVDYNPHATLSAIPLGKDNTKRITLYNVKAPGTNTNAQYDKDFASMNGLVPVSATDDQILGLPPGLTYDKLTGVISGVPTRAGSYDISIAGEPFLITVEKSILRYYAGNFASYYGESVYRGEASSDITFFYYLGDISKADRAYAADNGIAVDGDGGKLKELLGNDPAYTPPTFTAHLINGAPVTATSPAGMTYKIRPQTIPTSSNYNFELAANLENQPGSFGNTLQIMRRPVLVNTMAASKPVGQVYHDESGSLGALKATTSTGDTVFTTTLPDLTDGMYKGYPLGGTAIQGDEVLGITFNARYKQTEADLANDGSFTLTQEEEERDVIVSDLVLTEGFANNGNYSLEQPTPVGQVSLKGVVKLRGINAIKINKSPDFMVKGEQRYYGDGLESANGLQVTIQRGEGDDGIKDGIYPYDEKEFAKLGLHVNWVSPQEMADGLAPENEFTYVGSGRENNGTDKRPYTLNQILTADMNGYYICVSASHNTGSGTSSGQIIKAYSAVPIKVAPRTITLTATPYERFYGEENSAMTYTYNQSQLAAIDRLHGDYKGAGTAAELEAVLASHGYTPPTLKAVASPSKPDVPVISTTPVTGFPNSVLITGAASRNYNFTYYSKSGNTIQPGQGDSNFMIHPRPVVVEEISRGNLATIYADTKKLSVESIPLTLAETTLSLPTHGNGKTNYYPAGGTSNVDGSTLPCDFAQGAVPVLAGDGVGLSLTYSALFIPDHNRWNSFTDSYFDLTNAPTGTKDYSVEVGRLALTGAKAMNYTLVYKDNTAAAVRAPAHHVPTNGIKPGVNGMFNYLVAGEGTVLLRPIKSLDITRTPRMKYTYGEIFAPTQGATQGADGFTVNVVYDDRFENDAKNNITREPVVFGLSSMVDGSIVTTFDARGFRIGHLPSGTTMPTSQSVDDYLKNHTLREGDYITPAKHSGAKLFVVGRRGDSDPLVVSAPTDVALEVAPLTVNLTATNHHRFYGESNGTFGFTFEIDQLATPDRTALGKTNGVGTASDLIALSPTFLAPTYDGSAATPTSGVGTGGFGKYPLTLSGAKWSDQGLPNYTFSYTPASIYVYPRPVYVDTVNSSDKNPIYTIYQDTVSHVFTTDANESRVTLKLPVGNVYNQQCADGIRRDLPLNGAARYGTDGMNFKLTVDYVDFTGGIGEGQADAYADVRVTKILMLPGVPSYYNYALRDGDTGWDARGQIKLRTIDRIAIEGLPTYEYTYGETLDLSRLQVKIYYHQMVGEQQDREDVVYVGRDQFASYGLYVNYYDSPTVKETTPADRAAIKTKYRTATTGDHVTIAPTHDTQGTERPFAANGKYLIISAQRHKENDPATPLIVPTERDGSVSRQLVVKPKQLTYTLSAADKTYNGDAAAAGTLTLGNVFTASGDVDDYNTSGVTDVVFVPTGAPSQIPTGVASSHESFAKFKSEVAGGGYVFSTGSYLPNGTAPLGANGYVQWAPGYHYGGDFLTFSFVNPNVHYVDDTFASGLPGLALADYWRANQDPNTVTTQWDTYNDVSKLPVEVTGMDLTGPDAANYTWGASTEPRVEKTQVTMETRTAAVAGQAAAPYATIHKANRGDIKTLVTQLALPVAYPMVESSRHSNVVRMTHTQSLDAVGDNGTRPGDTIADQYNDELHYEYALQYQNGEKSVTQWAGKDGQGWYQDTLFFGGETYRPTLPQGYVPDMKDFLPDRIDENTVYKGQSYPWLDQDTGLSAGGYQVDGGFWKEASAYPGGAVYETYDLYNTDRTPLPRNTMFWPLVRVAETHNYHSSGAISSTDALTPALVNEAYTTAEALKKNPSNADLRLAAEAAAQAVLEATTTPRRDALDTALKQKEFDAALAVAGRAPENEPVIPAATAVKTYTQRLDLVSTSQRRSVSGSDDGSKEYLVELLEAVWFTDTLVYPEQRLLDAVVRNYPTRYYNFFWDAYFSAPLKFGDPSQLVDLTTEIENIEVRVPGEAGGQETQLITVNQDNIAKIYAQITAESGSTVRGIDIVPGQVSVRLGDAPYQLSVVTRPARPTNRRYQWTSSDEMVVKVDATGKLTFVGLGAATVTVTTTNNKSDTITVTVAAPMAIDNQESIFRFDYSGSWETLDQAGNFQPRDVLTRGELAILLEKFYCPNEKWVSHSNVIFADIAGEPYESAVKKLAAVGVISGTPEGKFAGEQVASRGEFATMLARMIGLPVVDTKNGPNAFQDATALETWAYAFIDALAKAGVVNGVGDGNFAPARAITRVETTAILARLLTVPLDTQQANLVRPIDVTQEDWAYSAILRALNEIIIQ